MAVMGVRITVLAPTTLGPLVLPSAELRAIEACAESGSAVIQHLMSLCLEIVAEGSAGSQLGAGWRPADGHEALKLQ